MGAVDMLLLVILILLAAAAGGFLGNLLEFAAGVILKMALIGAILGAIAVVGTRRRFPTVPVSRCSAGSVRAAVAFEPTGRRSSRGRRSRRVGLMARTER